MLELLHQGFVCQSLLGGFGVVNVSGFPALGVVFEFWAVCEFDELRLVEELADTSVFEELNPTWFVMVEDEQLAERKFVAVVKGIGFALPEAERTVIDRPLGPEQEYRGVFDFCCLIDAEHALDITQLGEGGGVADAGACKPKQDQARDQAECRSREAEADFSAGLGVVEGVDQKVEQVAADEKNHQSGGEGDNFGCPDGGDGVGPGSGEVVRMLITPESGVAGNAEADQGGDRSEQSFQKADHGQSQDADGDDFG